MISNSVNFAKSEWISITTTFPRKEIRRGKEFTDPFRRIGHSIAWVEWDEVCTIIKIEALQVRTGAATRLLAKLKEICDKHEVCIFGNATPYKPPGRPNIEEFLTQEELIGWYEKQGFVTKKSEETGATEIWYPGVPKS